MNLHVSDASQVGLANDWILSMIFGMILREEMQRLLCQKNAK
jgi:hypothetical protein